MNKKYRPLLKSLSALFTNFSAVWFGLAFVTPNFIDITNVEIFLTLTKDIGFGIVYLLLSMEIERILEYEQ